jgi:LysM repeat protein
MVGFAGWLGRGTVVLGLFACGAALGAGWKQGWIPVQLLSPETGRLAEPTVQEDSPAQNHSVPVGQTPLANDNLDAAFDLSILRRQQPSSVELATTVGRTSTPRANSATVDARPQESHYMPPAPGVQDDPPAALVQAQREPGPPRRDPAVRPVANEQDVLPLGERLAVLDEPIAQGEILDVHKELSHIYWHERSARPQIQTRLDQLAEQIFFLPQSHFIDPHVVATGDRLEAIAGPYKLTWEYLAKLNRTNPKRLQAGQKLKVLKGPFGAVVELADFTLTVHLHGYYVKRYSVGIGKDGSSPIGKFPVLNKVVNPQYTDPDGRVIAGDDPTNPLGERWIDLGNSYGRMTTSEPLTRKS